MATRVYGSSAGFWDEAGRQMGGRSYYLPRALQRYKRREFLSFLRGEQVRIPGAVLKTDVFEEAFGEDFMIDGLADEGDVVIGMDLSFSILKQARDRFSSGKKLCWTKTDISEIGFRDGAFSLVLSTGTCGYVEDVRQALREFYRVLRPGGRLVIAVNNRQNLFLRFMRRVPGSPAGPYPFARLYRCDDFSFLLESAGFTVKRSSAIVHIFPFLTSLVRLCEGRGSFARFWLARATRALEFYGKRSKRWRERTGWYFVFDAYKHPGTYDERSAHQDHCAV